MKSEVYSWRLSPELKKDLEAEARKQSLPISKLLDRISQDWLAQHRRVAGGEEEIRRRAERAIGAIAGDNPGRSRHAGEMIRRSLARQYGR